MLRQGLGVLLHLLHLETVVVADLLVHSRGGRATVTLGGCLDQLAAFAGLRRPLDYATGQGLGRAGGVVLRWS